MDQEHTKGHQEDEANDEADGAAKVETTRVRFHGGGWGSGLSGSGGGWGGVDRSFYSLMSVINFVSTIFDELPNSLESYLATSSAFNI